MRTYTLLISGLLVLGILNVLIYEKEQIKADGEEVFLKLAPVDPRSLMQGDYMRLRYAIDREIRAQLMGKDERAFAIITLDEHHVGAFSRISFDADATLASHERRFKLSRGSIQEIIPHSFMFQEGHAKFYEEAKYGVFVVSPSGQTLLIGLADQSRIIIDPDHLSKAE